MNVTVNFENFLSDSSIGSSGESRKDVSKIVEKLELLANSTGGDDFNINVKNNTGLAAFCIWFYFDGNALEFVDACATGEFLHP